VRKEFKGGQIAERESIGRERERGAESQKREMEGGEREEREVERRRDRGGCSHPFALYGAFEKLQVSYRHCSKVRTLL
jgi:hypothetical protein